MDGAQKGRKNPGTLLMELFEIRLLECELISDVGCFWSPSCFFMRRKARGGRLQHCCFCLTHCSNTRSPKWSHSPEVWPFQGHCPSVHIPLRTVSGTRLPNFKKHTKMLTREKALRFVRETFVPRTFTRTSHLRILKNWKACETWFEESLVVKQKCRQNIKTNFHYIHNWL